MAQVVDSARLLAALDVPVLLQGETGVGKTLLAEQMVAASTRPEQPLVSINCAALSAQRAAEQLFGERRPGQPLQPGYVQSAAGGTLLLDEVAELPLAVQGSLLRLLEQGEWQVVGESRPHQQPVRILATSNADMLARVRAGDFRMDLYQRLAVVAVQLPPLRERLDDLPVLLRECSEQVADQYHVSPIRFSASALKLLRRYRWPGNVRELKNLCQRLSLLLPGRVIDASNLPAEMLAESQRSRPGAMDLIGREVALIQKALDEAGGNKSRAARLLGISRDTLNYRLRKYKLV